MTNVTTIETDERLGLPSASGMERLIACPGSWKLEEAARASGYNEESQWAEAGTRIHKANETGDATELDIPEVELVERIRTIENRLLKEWMSEFNLSEESIQIRREHREWIHSGVMPVASAKLDFSATAGTRGLVLDLKSGRKVVSVPARNWQLRAGAVAIAEEFHLTDVRTAIVQPFAKSSPACDYDPASLSVCQEMIVSGYHAAVEGTSERPLHPGIHCEFCLARYGCAAIRESMGLLQKFHASRWDLIASEDKKGLWLMAKSVGKLSEDIQKRIEDELDENPSAVPGLMRKPDQKVRSISDPYLAVRAITDLLNGPLSPDDFNEIIFIGVGDVEKLVQSKLSRSGPKAKECVNDLLRGIIEFTPKRGSVVAVNQIKESNGI